MGDIEAELARVQVHEEIAILSD
eukprot:COSAG01_NODE_41296_length_453_cov_1.022599_1_plen_22_part_10